MIQINKRRLDIATVNTMENVFQEINNWRLPMPRKQCIMRIEQYTHMLCQQTTWFMFPLTQAPLGGIPEWCIPLISIRDCVIGKTGLARDALKPEFHDFPRSMYCAMYTPARHMCWLTHYLPGIPLLQSDGRIVTAKITSSRLSLFSSGLPSSGQALTIVVPVLPNFTITFTPQKPYVTPQYYILEAIKLANSR